ncbi:MAG: recombinase family protein [Natronospirillum sp.]
MSAYTYLRISEVESLQGGAGLRGKVDAELSRINAHAMAEGFGLTQSFIDRSIKWTTDFLDRPEAVRMMNLLEEGDSVLVNSLLRIFSSCEDMRKTITSFQKMGVRLYVHEFDVEVTDPHLSLPFERMLECFTSLEKKRSTERIKAVKENQRRQGRFLGGSRPFGYMIHSNGRLIENPMEQRVLKKILSMNRQGKSLRNISAEVSTPMMPISFKTVQRILKRQQGLPEGTVDRRRG